MNEITSSLIHYSRIITGERVVIAVLIIALLAMITYRENKKSSGWLFITIAASIIQLLGDSEAFSYASGTDLPYWLAYISYFISYTFGSLVVLLFSQYAKAYAEEKTTIKKWLFHVPVLTELVAIAVQTAAIISGTVFANADGRLAITGGTPPLVSLINCGTIIYILIASLTQVKKIGLKAAMLLGLFGLVPVVTTFICDDYTMMCGGLAVVVVYGLLKSDISAEKEQQKRALSDLNSELKHINEENSAQLKEITALNGRLQENQARLEESAAEHESQLEEIRKLNRDLRNRMDIIRSAIKVYFASYYIDIEADSYTELSAIENIKQHGFKTRGRAQESLTRMCSVLIQPEYEKAMETFVDLSTLDSRLQNTDSVTMQYIGNTTGWSQAFFIAGDRREDGTLKTVIWGARTIHEEKEKELDQLRTIEEAVRTQKEQIAKITELNRSLSDYNDAMANAGYGMWHILLKDGAAPRMQVNDKMAELLGIADQDLSEEELYNAWYDNIVPAAIPSVQASVGEMLAGHFSENTYEWVHPEKGVIYVRCGGTAQKLEDGTDLLSGYHADVTDIVYKEQKQKQDLQTAIENAEAANAAKTSFLFNMSHDIRTPMNAIMGFRDLLEKHQEDPERRRDYLNKIQDASTVLLSIINNVLEMARIEKGTLEIDETAWSTEQFNDTLYSVFHVMMAEKGLDFTRQIEVQHHYVYCDPTKLREIFINILSNAYKYTNAGGSVNMHLEEIPSEREGWVLYRTTISDTGIGMSEEFLPHIFEEFSRENNTTDARVEGTGLGMPIVKRLVGMLDGRIEVTSEKGKGSTFTVTIPHRIADKADLVEHAGVEIDPKLFKDKHILLAEDNDLNAEIAMEILAEAGFIVERAEDGRICLDMLERAEAGHYDLILMDIQMPNMNGYEATRAIRQLENSEKANIRILAMTANAFEEDKREALRAGMNGHLAKPINVNQLMRTLAVMIS